MSDNPGLTTIFVDEKATKRRLKRAKLLVVDGPDRGKELVIEREFSDVRYLIRGRTDGLLELIAEGADAV